MRTPKIDCVLGGDVTRGSPKLVPRTVHRRLVHHPEAEVVQAGRVWIVIGSIFFRRPKRVRELAIVVNDVEIAVYGRLPLAKA